MTRFPLRRLRLRPGEEHRDAVSIELEPFELGGLRYLPVPHEVESELTIVQATTGLDLRLAFDVRLHGPCMRCLTDAVVDSLDRRPRVPRERAGRGGRAAQRVRRRRPARAHRLGARRDRAGAAGPDPARARLRRSLPGLRQGPERRAAHARRRDARPALVRARGAPRPPVVRWRGASAPAHDGLDETRRSPGAYCAPSSSPRPLEAPCGSHSTASSVRSAPAPSSTTST